MDRKGFDIDMPDKSGKEVYDRIIRKRPEARVLFMSGYTADIISTKGIEETAVNFISKPVSRRVLLEKIRDIVDKNS